MFAPRAAAVALLNSSNLPAAESLAADTQKVPPNIAPMESQAAGQSSLKLAELFPKIKFDLENWDKLGESGDLIISNERIMEVKSQLGKVLGLPPEMPFALACNDTGSALLGTPLNPILRGIAIVDGSNGIARIDFSVNLKGATVQIEEQEFSLQEVPAAIRSIQEEASRTISRDELMRRIALRHEEISFYATDQRGREIFVTENSKDLSFGGYDRSLHMYIATADSAQCVSIIHAVRFRDGGSTRITGTLPDGKEQHLKYGPWEAPTLNGRPLERKQIKPE